MKDVPVKAMAAAGLAIAAGIFSLYVYGPIASGDPWVILATVGLAVPAVTVVSVLLVVTAFLDEGGAS